MKQDKNHRRWMNLLRLLIVFSLLIVYFQNTPVYPALAYSGDYALEFDGVSDFVQLDTALNILGSNWQSTKTISVWVRPTGIAPDVAAIANVPLGDMIVGDHPRWFGIYQANVTPTNQDRIWVWNTDNTDLVGNAYIGIPYTIGEWVHITLVHTNNMLYAYKNGILIGSQPSGRTAYAHTSASTIKLRIGGRETGQLFQGQIDEVRMWNTALTENEIRQDMYRTLAGTESGLAAYYKMSNGTGTILTDDSIHTWDGTLADGATGAGNVPPDGDTATWVTSGAFAGPRNALDFDGTDDYVSVP
ncbi:MAG TPA: hypothetical protein DEH25_12375, partial [Chloroflexi bacterium]|nr:hypothetical protein [Chloroflexota bacterium]